jgi:hypothetical protein
MTVVNTAHNAFDGPDDCTICERAHAVNIVNSLLIKSGYRLRSEQAPERILEQRDLELFAQGGLPCAVLGLLKEAHDKGMIADEIVGRLFPDLQGAERAALGEIIDHGLSAWTGHPSRER